jgi:TIR domain
MAATESMMGAQSDSPQRVRDSIFISYSHADSEVFSQLQAVLHRLATNINLTIWSDTRIIPASQWRGEIEEALATSAAAILLVSRAFLRSNFIREHELPPLRDAARRGELRIFIIILEACDHHGLTETFQAVNDPSRPLDKLAPAEREAVWHRLESGLREVAAEIDDEVRIGAEMVRVRDDMAGDAKVSRVATKIAQARVDPAFAENEPMRENTLVFLEGQLSQAQSTWLIEESKRSDLSETRAKAVVRCLQEVQHRDELALKRAGELTQKFATDTLAILQEAKDGKTRHNDRVQEE